MNHSPTIVRATSMSIATPPQTEMTVEELAARVGAIPYWRVRMDPPPGTGTEEDQDRIRRRGTGLCELLDGVLVDKSGSMMTSVLGASIATDFANFVRERWIGWIQGPDGFTWLSPTRLRAPNVSFIRRDQRSNGKLLDDGYADIAPAVAVEIFSHGNTVREIEQKRREFLAAGTELFWIVYPDREEIEVFTDPETHQTLARDDMLDGGAVLPGFSVKVAEIFGAVELK